MYTNHCVRASAIQRLVDAGIAETSIIATPGQRQVQSLASYATRNTDTKKKEIAAVLDGSRSPACSTVEIRSADQSETAQPKRPLAVPPPQCDTDDLEDTDDFIANCDIEAI